MHPHLLIQRRCSSPSRESARVRAQGWPLVCVFNLKLVHGSISHLLCMIQFTKLCSSGYNTWFLALEKNKLLVVCGYLKRIWTVYERLVSAGWLREHASVICSSGVGEESILYYTFGRWCGLSATISSEVSVIFLVFFFPWNVNSVFI